MYELQRQKYLENSVQTASQSQLLLMLVDGAIRFSRQASAAIERKQVEEAHQCLCRVRDIITEWVITLDRTSPLAAQLLPLYDYLLSRTIQANVRKDPKIIEEILEFLLEIRDMWTQASRTGGAKHISYGG